MAHESWPRCDWCEGVGCRRCSGEGRTKPADWVEPAAPEYAQDEAGNILYHEGTETPVLKGQDREVLPISGGDCRFAPDHQGCDRYGHAPKLAIQGA